jgi:hypothetical protein
MHGRKHVSQDNLNVFVSSTSLCPIHYFKQRFSHALWLTSTNLRKFQKPERILEITRLKHNCKRFTSVTQRPTVQWYDEKLTRTSAGVTFIFYFKLFFLTLFHSLCLRLLHPSFLSCCIFFSLPPSLSILFYCFRRFNSI